jgi:hypothetical protein
MERLCSGATKSRASAVATSDLNRATFSGTGCLGSWLYIGRSSSRINLISKARAPELGESLRQLAVNGFATVAADENANLELCHAKPPS